MEYWADVLNQALLLGVLAVSLNLLIGFAGYLSLAQAAFYGIGAYTAALLTIHLGWGFVPTTIAAIVVSGIFGALIAFPAIRISGEYVVLLTLAFLEVINQLEVAWIPVTGGASGLFPVPPANLFGYEFGSPSSYLPLFVVFVLAALVVGLIVGGSPFGRVLRGLREDSRGTRALGKNVVLAAVVVFGVTTAIAGAAGSLSAHYLNFASPTSFDLNASILIAAIVVLGGTGNLYGSVLGSLTLAFLLAMLTELDIDATNAAVIRQICYGVALILVMRFRPQGLLPERLPRETRKVRRAAKSAGPAPTAAGAQRSVGDADLEVEDLAVDPMLAASVEEALGAAVAETHPRREVQPDTDDVVVAQGIVKSFSGLKALDGVDIGLRRGSITILVGANGAGKTTLFNVLTGDLHPDEGTVSLNGTDITRMRPDLVARRGLVRSFQDVRIFQRLSVLENVVLARPDQPGEKLWRVLLTPRAVRRAEAENRAAAHRYLELVGLDERAGELAGDLAYGEQKLLAIARLVATDADVLLLDEPSSGVDPVWVDRILDLIVELRDRGKTICIVEHSLDVVRKLPGEAFFLGNGKVIARGNIEDLMGRAELVETYFGV